MGKSEGSQEKSGISCDTSEGGMGSMGSPLPGWGPGECDKMKIRTGGTVPDKRA